MKQTTESGKFSKFFEMFTAVSVQNYYMLIILSYFLSIVCFSNFSWHSKFKKKKTSIILLKTLNIRYIQLSMAVVHMLMILLESGSCYQENFLNITVAVQLSA